MTKLDENDLVEYHLFAQGAEVLGIFGVLLNILFYGVIALTCFSISLAYLFDLLGF